jgi:hypothetical protein
MKTTYPPNTATSPAEWQTYSKLNLNAWYMYINTERDNPNQLNYATIERQLVALRLKIQNCSIKQYYPLKGKIEKLEKQLKDQKSRQAWNDFLAR